MQIKLTEVDNYLDMMNIVIRNIFFLKLRFNIILKKTLDLPLIEILRILFYSLCLKIPF